VSDGEPAATVRAAGAVVWRGSAADPEIVLIRRPRYDDWTLPKGKVLAGEPLPVAAAREVQEETGLSVVLGRPLPAQGYFTRNRPKRVDYWAGQVGAEAPFRPNPEVDEIAWLPTGDAARRLTYPPDVDTVRALTSAPLPTTPYILLRHAEAGDSESWPGDDALRPLDDDGRVQAATLARVLACYAPADVITSPAARCVQTVRPYADAAGIEIASDDAFAADAPWSTCLARAKELLCSERPVVLCGHGENMPAIVTWASVELGAPPPVDPSLAKGGLWVLHVAKGSLAGLEYHAV
jgi:8-oxo-(d)GTP phosphatase